MHLSCKFRDYTFSWLLRVYFVFIFERYFCCFYFSTLKLSLNCHLACMVSLLLTLTFVPLYIIFLFPWATFKIFSWSFAYITLNTVCLGVFCLGWGGQVFILLGVLQASWICGLTLILENSVISLNISIFLLLCSLLLRFQLCVY